MAIPSWLDPNNRPGAQLFASPSAYTGGVLNAVTPLPQQSPFPMVPNSMAAQGGIIQVPEEKPGILGRIGRGLANPAINQRLSALGAELLANSGYHQIPVTTGAGLGRGLQAMNQAGQAYDQMLGSQAAAALDKRMKEAQLKKAEREAAGQLDALKYQFGGAVITEQDGVKGFSIPVQNPQTGEISAKFVPVGSNILSRTTGLSAQDQAILDISTAGGKTEAQIRAENALAPQTAEAKAQIAGATAGAAETAKAQAEKQATAAQQAAGAGDMLTVLDRVESLLPGASQNAISGGLKGALAEYGGIATDSRVVDKRLQLLGTELVSEQARSKILGANPTEGERALYEKLVGQIQNPGPLNERMAAVDEMRIRFGRIQQRGQQKPASGPAAAPAKVRKWNPATGRVE